MGSAQTWCMTATVESTMRSLDAASSSAPNVSCCKPATGREPSAEIGTTTLETVSPANRDMCCPTQSGAPKAILLANANEPARGPGNWLRLVQAAGRDAPEVDSNLCLTGFVDRIK